MEKKSLITRLAILSVNNPLRVVILALFAVLISLYSALSIEIQTSNLDLIDADNVEVQNFLSFAEKFGNPNTLLVVLEGVNEQSLALASQTTAAAIETLPDVNRVISRIPIDPIAFMNNDRSTFYTNKNGTAYFLFVQPKDTRTQVAAIAPLVSKIKDLVKSNLTAFTDIKVGYTGIPQYALDDQNIIQADLSFLSIVSFLLVLSLFIFTFQELKGPILAASSLLFAVILTLGLVSVYPGHLTLLSAPFAMMLFGLAEDYGVHILTHLEHLLAIKEDSYKEKIIQTMSTLSRSLLTACTTTIIVFLILLVSGFKGFRELGLIAGVGIAISFVSIFTLFPALLMLFPIKRKKEKKESLFFIRFIEAITNSWLAPILLVISILSFLIPAPFFDSNYLNLQPKNSETVRLERMITEDSRYSPYFAAFILNSIEEVRAVSSQLKVNPLVGEVKSITELGDFTIESLPPSLTSMFKDSVGRYAVYAFPNQSIWDPNYEAQFLEGMRSINSNVTGLPFVGNAMINKTKAALKITERLALLFIAIIVLLDFRKIPISFFVMLPPIFAMLLMQAFMHFVEIPYNPLNIMALPIVLGIAVDYSIYVAHSFVDEKGDLHKALNVTGKSLLLNTLTTLASFGTLSFTSHLGLRSFGIILAFGIGFSFILAITVLPWLLVKFKTSVLSSSQLSKSN